jgi:tetratricopeptide (TPR) repeat protein
VTDSLPDYEELQLRVRPGQRGAYRVEAVGPDGSRASGTFRLPVDETQLDNFVLQVGQPRRNVRKYRSPQMERAKEFGGQLFDALVAGDVRDLYRSARSAADARGVGLRVTLYLTETPTLMSVPWEFLFERPSFLAQSIYTPLVRSLDLKYVRQPHPVVLPLRILGVVSRPKGVQALDVEGEQQRLTEALAPLSEAGLVTLEWLPRATLSELHDVISRPGEIHVLHYIGHGAYDERTDSGILLFEDEDGLRHEVTGEELGTLLQDEHSLRLVVLNSCEGARTSHIDPFSGVASSLVEVGIPAVIGMQFEITDEAAVTFGESLYKAVVNGYPVDAALAQVRKAIFAARHDVEFGTPVLFLRATDAHLFRFDSQSAPLSPPVPVAPPADRSEPAEERVPSDDPRYLQGVDAFYAGRWDEAVERFTVVAREYPGDDRVSSRLEEARGRRDIADWYDQGIVAEQHGDWDTAVADFERVVAIDSGYQDAADRLEQVRREQQKNALLDDIQRLHGAGQWTAVVAAGEELARLDPDGADPDGLVSAARTELADERLDARYTEGLHELDRHDWAAAIDTFTGIEEDRPDYRDTRAHLAEATRLAEGAPAGEAAPPPDDGEPSDGRGNRFSRRSWILTATGIAVVLIGVASIVAVTNLGGGNDSVLFEDDFSSQAGGWLPAAGTTGTARYQDGSYHISADPGDGNGAASLPVDADSVYPAAPLDLNIEVETHVVKGPSASAQYGILCRTTETGYAFAVAGQQARIVKFFPDGSDRLLNHGPAQVDLSGTNKLSATCESDGAQTQVHLQFEVNGGPVVEATDKNPTGNGTVGLFVNGEEASSAAEVQFDNFVVTRA